MAKRVAAYTGAHMEAHCIADYRAIKTVQNCSKIQLPICTFDFGHITEVGLILVPNPFRFCDYNNNTLSWTSQCQIGVSLMPTF